MALQPNAIRPINQTFEVSPAEAGQLWADSMTIPGEDQEDRSLRFRISACGKWGVRKMEVGLGYNLSGEDHTKLALAELDELQGRGVPVISRGMTPSPGGSHVFTITPWLKDMEPCSPAVYTYIENDLETYYREGPPSSWAIRDIDSWTQFSALSESSVPAFLHDPDPYIATRDHIAAYGLLRNIQL